MTEHEAQDPRMERFEALAEALRDAAVAVERTEHDSAEQYDAIVAESYTLDALRAYVRGLLEAQAPVEYGVRNRVGMWTTVYATAEEAQGAIDEMDRARVVALIPVGEP